MSLRSLAEETVKIVESGGYRAPSGRTVSIAAEVRASVEGTRLVRPDDVLPLPPPREGQLRLEVTGEKTGDAARRLVGEGARDVLALNFASAKNPGGGFLGGARAQEEDLARCSALYATLVTQPAYYAANRASGSMLYTDHAIYSPAVPFFRNDALELLEAPCCVAVLTSPAPNAGEALGRDPESGPAIEATLQRRARQVLRIAAAFGHRTLVLGAWGCGVFRNDPVRVADAFSGALADLPGAFDRVVFAVWDRTGEGPNLRAFRDRFGNDSLVARTQPGQAPA